MWDKSYRSIISQYCQYLSHDFQCKLVFSSLSFSFSTQSIWETAETSRCQIKCKEPKMCLSQTGFEVSLWIKIEITTINNVYMSTCNSSSIGSTRVDVASFHELQPPTISCLEESESSPFDISQPVSHFLLDRFKLLSPYTIVKTVMIITVDMMKGTLINQRHYTN